PRLYRELVALVRSEDRVSDADPSAQYGECLLSLSAASVPPRAAVEARLVTLLASGTLAFGVFLQGFVVREPAPYELYMAGLIAIWGLFGLRLSRHAAILLALL